MPARSAPRSRIPSVLPPATAVEPRQWWLLPPPPVETGVPPELPIVTTIEADALFPPASWAVIVMVLVPATSGMLTLQEFPPGSVPLWRASALLQEIEATPTLSEAVPLMVNGLDDAVAVGDAGFVIAIVGGVVSLADPTTRLTERELFPAAFVVFVNVMVSV
jgi:hypothetical protein